MKFSFSFPYKEMYVGFYIGAPMRDRGRRLKQLLMISRQSSVVGLTYKKINIFTLENIALNVNIGNYY